jgi:aminoglycoside phosphotransferase (APT) family kinase protein
MPEDLTSRCVALIEELGLGQAAQVSAVVPLAGGVASDIARVDVDGKSYCVKFALEKLRVAADWHAPVHRSRAEYSWLGVAGQVARTAVPEMHGYSATQFGFAMEFLSGPGVRLWKAALLAGESVGDEAARVADVLGRIHAAGAAHSFDRGAFDNSADFHAIRVEPYLLFTAQRHPSVADRLTCLADGLDASSVTLIHGDVSPKNILFRGGQPVFLDAECATMGDPCFDIAFCMNHLILKAVHVPGLRHALLAAVIDFWRVYAPHVNWEGPAALEGRVAALLPALMLARVDGKSPVEYLSEADKVRVRAMALNLLRNPEVRLQATIEMLAAGLVR